MGSRRQAQPGTITVPLVQRDTPRRDEDAEQQALQRTASGPAPESAADTRQLRRIAATQPSRLGPVMRRLQRAYGNRRVAGLLQRAAVSEDENEEAIRRVTIDEEQERESLRRVTVDEEEGNNPIQRAPVGLAGGEVAPEVERAIEGARGGGQALDSGVRSQMEGALGADFGGVRVHTGTEADRLNRQISARAFTTGHDIFFRQGAYQPTSTSGRELLAHELTHVVQQGGGVRAKLTVGAAGDTYEEEADRVARAVVQPDTIPGAKRYEMTAQSKHLLVHDSMSIPQQEFGRYRLQRRPQPITSSTDSEARIKHWEKFFALAVVLRSGKPLKYYRQILLLSEAGRGDIFSLALEVTRLPSGYPELIEIPSEGKDLLIWGSPARYAVLNLLCEALLSWATSHLNNPRFLEHDPLEVASLLLEYSGYKEMLDWADRQPLAHEYIDRNEILPSTVLSSFGEAVAQGLLIIGLVGFFVGAEAITAGQATWLLVGLAGTQGISSYLARREEVEEKGYDVPIPESIGAAVGDIVGVSQLIEGITGQRLGTQEQLGSKARSQQTGSGGGTLLMLLFGSRAYRGSQQIGRTWRLAHPPKTPSGPYGNISDPFPSIEQPSIPTRNPHPGPVEASIRARLPENDQVGLDLFIEKIKAKGTDPEVALKKIPEPILDSQIKNLAESYRTRIKKYEEFQSKIARAKDNPLRPRLKHNKRKGEIWIHYENTPPTAQEIKLAQELARISKEEVHLFGDTPAGHMSPGIDGTIGMPPRPLSVKSAAPEWARWHAQEALVKASQHGYSKVTVYLRVRGKLADALAYWNQSPPKGPLKPTFRHGIIAEILLQADDAGVTLVTPMGIPLVPPAFTPHQDRQQNEKSAQ